MKKIFSSAIAFSMAFSSVVVTAYAAPTYNNVEVNVSDEYNATLKLIADDAGASHQVTILAHKKGVGELLDSDIKYIDQLSYSDFTANELNFTLGNNVEPGAYTLKVGGSDISTPTSVDFETKVTAPTLSSKAGNPTTINKGASNQNFTFVLDSENDYSAAFAAGIKDGKKAYVNIATLNPIEVPVSVSGTELTVDLGNNALGGVSGSAVEFTLSFESVGFKNAESSAVNVTLTGVVGPTLEYTQNVDLNGNSFAHSNPLGIEGAVVVTISVPTGFDPTKQHVQVKNNRALYSPVRNKFIYLLSSGTVSEADVKIVDGAVDASDNLYYGVLSSDNINPAGSDVMTSLELSQNVSNMDKFSFKQRLAVDVDGDGKITIDDVNAILNKYFTSKNSFEIELK